MNTTQLQCFLAVAENLNFARAAEQLHITQPAVTHQINSLEEELNVKLFHRTTRMVEMTDSGFRFLHDARDILKITNSAKQRLAKPLEKKSLSFSIGCPNSYIVGSLTKPLQLLIKAYPELHPVLKMLPEKRLQNLLTEEALHVIFDFKEGLTAKETETFVPLTKVPVVCITSSDKQIAKQPVLTSGDLKTGKMIICEPHHIPAQLFSLLGSFISTRPQSDLFFCDNLTCALTLAKAGCGFLLLPGPILSRDKDLTYTPVEDLPEMHFGVYYKKNLSHPVLKPFLEILAACFSDE